MNPSAPVGDRYVLERELGRGGMATVFRAVDLKHTRPVALKVLRPELAHAVGVDRFLREIQVLSTLTHPHIVPLLDSGSTDSLPFYVMPLIEGETLRARLRREPQLPVADAMQIARDLASALSYAHRRGVIHRDIKPENILLTEENALLADFGIAYAVTRLADTDQLTESGLVIGSPMYMSPEQGDSHARVDARADLYSLGCVMYEMLTGSPPFTGPTAQAILSRHACDPVPPIHTVRSTVPPHVEATILQLLAKSPADRIPTATGLIQALERPAGAQPIRRWRRGTAVSILAGVAAVTGIALFASRAGQPAQGGWIMVGDFVGPSSDSTLAIAIRELVTVELDQSRSFTTMPRQQVVAALRSAGYPDSARITPEIATELADRSSVRTVVTGSILPVAGESYSVALRATSVEDGEEIASIAGSATPANLIEAVGNLARRLRRALGERRDAVAAKRPLQQVTTPSFPAYQRYVLGLDRIYAGDFAGGNRLLHEAIGIDSAFASAWAALGTSHVFGRNLDSAQLAFSRALSFPDRLTETQRYGVEADAAHALRHDLPAAISWYDLFLAQDPRSMAARNNRALFLSSLGRHEEALEEFRRALAINPFGPDHVQIELLNQAAELVVLGRVREGTAAARELKGPFADYFAVLRPSAVSDWVTAESTAARIAETEGIPSFLRIQAATTEAAARAAQGAVAHAELLLRTAAEKASGEEMRWYDQARLLLAIAADRAPGPVPHRLANDSSTAGRLMHALWAGVRGDTNIAAKALEQAGSRPEEFGRLGVGPRLARAWIDGQAGRQGSVIDSLARMALHGEHDATILDRVSSFPVRWLVADAYARSGRLDSATSYLELLLAPTRMAPGHFALRGFTYPFAHRRLALWYAALGRADTAAAHWKSFTQSLRKPDPEVAALLARPPLTQTGQSTRSGIR